MDVIIITTTTTAAATAAAAAAAILLELRISAALAKTVSEDRIVKFWCNVAHDAVLST